MGALGVIDIRLHDGHARQAEVRQWPVRIGRALDNDVVLDDPRVAAHHLSVYPDEAGPLRFAVGETRNGIRLDGKRYGSGSAGIWPPRLALHLGETVLLARTAAETLPDEQPLARRTGSPLNLLLLTALFAYAARDAWLDQNQALSWWRMLLPPFTALALLLVVWTGGWSLVSKLFTKLLDGTRHLRIALIGLLLVIIGNETLARTAFAFNLPGLERYSAYFNFAAFAALAYAHLRAIAPARRWRPLLWVGVPALALAAAFGLQQYARSGNPAGNHFMTALYPPAWRVAAPRSLDDFIADSATVQSALDARAADPSEDDREYPE